MAAVARTRQGDRLLPGSGSLMDRCLDAGLPVASACSGSGVCGRCLITVLEGVGALEPPSPREAALLAKLGAEADQRLSCQCLPPDGAELLITTGYW